MIYETYIELSTPPKDRWISVCMNDKPYPAEVIGYKENQYKIRLCLEDTSIGIVKGIGG